MTICWNINILRSEREKEKERERNGSFPKKKRERNHENGPDLLCDWFLSLSLSPDLSKFKPEKKKNNNNNNKSSSFIIPSRSHEQSNLNKVTWDVGLWFPEKLGKPPPKKNTEFFIFPIMVYVWVVVCFDHKPNSNTLLSSRDVKKHKNQIFPVPNSRGTANRD